ncbi:MAG: ComEC/Rec2 family competence protein [candidate division WOR-3 bacterium]
MRDVFYLKAKNTGIMQILAIRICLLLIGGVLCNHILSVPEVIIISGIIVTLLLSLWRVRFLYPSLFFLSGLNAALHKIPVTLPPGKFFKFQGEIISEEIFGSSMRFLVRTRYLLSDSCRLKLPIQFYFYHHNLESHLGDEVLITGCFSGRNKNSLNQPATVFGMIRFEKRRGGSIFERKLFFPLRQYFKETFIKVFSAEYAHLTTGLVIGGQSGLSEDLKRIFANAGVTHILAVSGLHITYIIGFFYLLFKILRIPLKQSFILISIVLLIYAGVTAFRPSVMRATLMGIFLGLAGIMERRTSLVHLTTVSLIILLFFDPLMIFNVSAQLSYSAVYGILLLFPWFEKRLFSSVSNWIKRYLLAPLTVSFSAQLFTSPLLIYYFNRLPTMALLSNLIVVPLSTIAVTLGFIVSFCNIFSLYLARVFGGTLELILRVMIMVTRFFGGQSFSVIKLATPPVILIILFYFIFGPKRIRSRATILFITLLNLTTWAKILVPSGVQIHNFENSNFLIRLPDRQNIALVRQNSRAWQHYLIRHNAERPDLNIFPSSYQTGSLHVLQIIQDGPIQFKLTIGPEIKIRWGEVEIELADRYEKAFTIGKKVFYEKRAGDKWEDLSSRISLLRLINWE